MEGGGGLLRIALRVRDKWRISVLSMGGRHGGQSTTIQVLTNLCATPSGLDRSGKPYPGWLLRRDPGLLSVTPLGLGFLCGTRICGVRLGFQCLQKGVHFRDLCFASSYCQTVWQSEEPEVTPPSKRKTNRKLSPLCENSSTTVLTRY